MQTATQPRLQRVNVTPLSAPNTSPSESDKVNFTPGKHAVKHQKMCSSDTFLALPSHRWYIRLLHSASVFVHPLTEDSSPVWIKRGLCSADSLINIALCILGYLPGLLHAWYIISPYPECDYEEIPNDGGEGGRAIYYYVNPREQEYPSQQQAAGPKPAQQGYGTTHGMNSAPAPTPEARSSAEGDQGVPPSYEQAIKGDYNVQT